MDFRHAISVCAPVAAGSAQGATVLDFGIKAPTAGTLSYSGYCRR
jgi:hypothetical protein